MKSIVYPYIYYMANGVWVMRDGVGDKPRRISRKSEVVAWKKSAAEVIEAIKEENLGRHFVSHFVESQANSLDIKNDYKVRGYRYLLSEGFFIHDSQQIPDFQSSPRVQRVTTAVDSDRIRRERRNRKAIRDVDLVSDDPQHRLYAVIDRDKAKGWVGSVPFGNKSWIADLYVLPECRSRGIGRALMCEVTRDDRQHGVESSLLLASAAGARLYPYIGYRQIGTLLLFCPKR